MGESTQIAEAFYQVWPNTAAKSQIHKTTLQ